MFCPKCGANAIEGTKFCRTCGTDLSVISEVLTGKLMIQDSSNDNKKGSKRKLLFSSEDLTSGAYKSLFTGLAFAVIVVFLMVTNTIGGRVWAFWLLIPAFAMLGKAISDLTKAKQLAQKIAVNQNSTPSLDKTPVQPTLNEPQIDVLPPSSFASSPSFFKDLQPARNTGELVPPPSVVENTTRTLSHETENPTRTF
ncbi:MAG: hypothetical protein H7Z37_08845, partial [Pyrinomonadaceae bacterium]|nr:hypothetical protein [Pyrinomonadaceae bacterium]